MNVRFRVPFGKAKFVEAFMPDAEKLAKLPKLRWKIWTFDDDAHEFASVYLFDDITSAKAFSQGPVLAAINSNPQFQDFHASVHEVMEDLTRVTRGPIG